MIKFFFLFFFSFFFLEIISLKWSLEEELIYYRCKSFLSRYKSFESRMGFLIKNENKKLEETCQILEFLAIQKFPCRNYCGRSWRIVCKS